MNNAYQKWLAGEGCCNAHNFIHIETSDCKKQDVCECERILLEISNLHTDDAILQEEIDDLSGQVESKLDASAYTPVDLTDYYTKEEVDALIPEVPSLSGYATEQWVLDKHYITGVDLSDYAKLEDIPSLSGYATEQWVENKNYLTEHQPLKTINGYTISGTGNIEITASGGSISVDSDLSLVSTNPVENKVITEALNDKLDASAYTPTEQVQSDWNVTDSASTAYIKNKPTIPTVPTNVSAFNNDAGYITGVDLSNYATLQDIPTVPTSNSAFTNDEHFITSADTVFNNYALTANTYTKTEVDSKFWCGTQAEYDVLQNKRNDVLYLIHE